MSRHKTSIIKTIDHEFAKKWRRSWIKAVNANFFNSYEWFLAWQNTHPNKQYQIICCWEEGELTAILPLVKSSYFGMTAYQTIGGTDTANPAYLLISSKEKVLKKLFEPTKEFNLIITEADHDTAIILSSLFPKADVRISSVNPFVELSNRFKYLSNRGHKRLKKKIKKYKGKLEFKINNSADLQNSLKTMIEIEQKSSKKVRGKDIFSNLDTRRLYENLIEHAGKYIQINFLYYENQPIAYSFDLAFNKTYLGYQIAYDNDFSNLSPGKLMKYLTLKNLQNDHYEVFDMSAGFSDHKRAFAQEFYLQYMCLVPKNIIVEFWWKTIQRLRRSRQIFFPEKYTKDSDYLFKPII